jgi:hypothetical protein
LPQNGWNIASRMQDSIDFKWFPVVAIDDEVWSDDEEVDRQTRPFGPGSSHAGGLGQVGEGADETTHRFVREWLTILAFQVDPNVGQFVGGIGRDDVGLHASVSLA